MKPQTLAMNGFEIYRKTTRKGEFLSRMDVLVPWAEFCAVIEPYYPKAGDARRPVGLERMLRMYFIANWFNLAAALLAKVGELLLSSGLKLSDGTIVDATIIAAPSSTKNADKTRGPEMRKTKKGNQWYFGIKVHIGVDSNAGLTHSVSITSANVHDSQELPNLLHGNETRLYGDSVYTGQKAYSNRLRQKQKTSPTKEPVAAHRRRKRIKKPTAGNRMFVPRLSIYGFAKVRYRSLTKNANRAFAFLALINLDKWGSPLTGRDRYVQREQNAVAISGMKPAG